MNLTATQQVTVLSLTATQSGVSVALQPIIDQSGDGGDMTAAVYDAAGITEQLVGLTASQTLTNKTLTSPVLNTGVTGTAILDDDTMATASATTLATSESIKAYVDANTGGSSILEHSWSGMLDVTNTNFYHSLDSDFATGMLEINQTSDSDVASSVSDSYFTDQFKPIFITQQNETIQKAGLFMGIDGHNITKISLVAVTWDTSGNITKKNVIFEQTTSFFVTDRWQYIEYDNTNFNDLNLIKGDAVFFLIKAGTTNNITHVDITLQTSIA